MRRLSLGFLTTLFVSSLIIIHGQERHLSNMKFIEGGTFTLHGNFQTSTEDNIDSTYLCFAHLARNSTSNFYLSNHEVTNGEYWEFIKWVQDSVARKYLFEGSAPDKKALWGHYVDYKTYNVDTTGKYFVLNWDTPLNFNSYTNYPILKPILNSNYGHFSQYNENFIDQDRLTFCYEFPNSELESGIYSLVDVFPNTSHWSEAFRYGFEDLSANYFTSKIYQDYPVVGVSYLQAIAYCNWRTKEFKTKYEALSRKQKRYFSRDIEFRLPTEAEWEYAAINHDESHNFELGYLQKDGKYQANFGEIVLKSNIRMKSWMDDGAMTTAKVGSYLPNSKGIYDIFGNVAEWTSDTLNVNGDYFDFYKNDNSLLGNFLFKGKVFKETTNQLLITNPYTKQTHLVIKGSEEHQNLLNLRKEYYAVSPHDSEEEIFRKYIAFNSIDSEFYDSLWVLNKRDLFINEEIDSLDDFIVKPIERNHNNWHFYDNSTGKLSQFNDWDSIRMVARIRTFIHDVVVVERASNYPSNNYVTENRIVKGGSWADQPHYLVSGSREIYNEAESSCKVGFRVAMDAPQTIDFLSLKDKRSLKKLRKNTQRNANWE